MLIINGKTYQGSSISVRNGQIIIDGKDVTNDDDYSSVLTIKVEGPAINVSSDVSVQCGDVQGSVQAGGSVNCDVVGGDARAGGSVNCNRIIGSAVAGGSINHG